MPSFPRPRDEFRYDQAQECQTISDAFNTQGVPSSRSGSLLIATWNLANLGAQKRTASDLGILAHVIKRFDLIAIQEVKDDTSQFRNLMDAVGSGFDYIMSDTAGNQERLVYVYRKSKVKLGRVFGELALPKKDFPSRDVAVPIKSSRDGSTVTLEVYQDFTFSPFDRNPFLGTFHWGDESFLLANVHLYFGKFRDSANQEDRMKYVRRVLEIYALAKWARSRKADPDTYSKNIILLGDMNIPTMLPDDSAYEALRTSGFKPMPYSTKTGGTNLGNDKTYDQIAMTPGIRKERVENFGVFSFDLVVFRDLWESCVARFGAESKAARVEFNKYLRSYLSDHRPIWLELKS